MRSRLTLALWLAGLLGVGCAVDPRTGIDPRDDSGTGIDFEAKERTAEPPPRTTDGRIFLGNLDSRIAATERVIDRRGQDLGPVARARLQATLAADHLERAWIVGRLEDLDRAEALSRSAYAAAPDDFAVLRVRSRVLAALHRFEEALGLLAPLPESPELNRLRASLTLAMGHYDRAPVASPRESESGDLRSVVAQADRLFDEGRRDEAYARLVAVADGYRGVSPFVRAWLEARHGILLLREGRLDAAALRFERAREHLPAYALATEHLAEVRLRQDRIDDAVRLYRAVSAATGNPEFFAQLAVASARAGDHSGAAAASVRAREGFEHWLAAHPEAFADHAATFYLDQGEADRALALAELNLAGRRTVGAWLLLAEAARAAGAGERACDAWSAALATGQQPPELEAARIDFAACADARVARR